MKLTGFAAILTLLLWEGTAAPAIDELSPAEKAAVVAKAVETFFAAPDVAALKKLVREPARVGPLMDAHYAGEGFDLPEVRPVSRADLKIAKGFYVASVVTKTFATFPVVLEPTEAGLLVDWESFVGYSEVSWSDMARGEFPEKPALLRARMRPSDYFNYGFSDDEYYCVQLYDARLDKSIYGYVKHDSKVAAEIVKRYARPGDDFPFRNEKISNLGNLLFDESVLADPPQRPEEEPGFSGLDFVILRIKAPAGKSGKNQVEITEFVAEGWVFAGEHKE